MVSALQNFLNDYGLIWVGDGDTDDCDDDCEQTHSSGTFVSISLSANIHLGRDSD